ncbi:phospholipase D-like domain-containing protein [Corallococcus sp. Z5C101001]|uniref:phospholipase D-like domain-containing protein n=1 Tax=Corallococcus sp. Z5C101001 TaxID=2596829 RepID=UPI00117C8A5B|nr:phospholipase D-like domain-containing protein [Corallococcus sp. Z5C101001]TSC27832.1 phospholipase [Corallococcus sp. Z5C101001]
MRPIDAELLAGRALYQDVVLRKLAHARESVWMATANVKAMYVERAAGRFVPLLEVLDGLAARGVALRLLHAELPSRPFRAAFDARSRLVKGGLELKVCPRVHFKAVVVDGAWVYLGSANLTGAGLGAKGEDVRNFEMGFVTEDFDTIDRTTALFDAVWSGAECRGCRLRSVCPDPILPSGVGQAKKRGRDAVRLGKARRLRRPREDST